MLGLQDDKLNNCLY